MPNAVVELIDVVRSVLRSVFDTYEAQMTEFLFRLTFKTLVRLRLIKRRAETLSH